LTRPEAEAQIVQATESYTFPTVLRADFTPDFVLSCPTGPTLATLSGQTAPLLEGRWPDSRVLAWSPDGRRLSLRLAGRLSWIDLVLHGGAAYVPPSFDDGIAPVWVSKDLVVYPSVRPNGTGAINGNEGLTVLNISSGQKFWPNDSLYVPSPD